ncbi:hypothetical protein [Actinomadura sp. NTSP31]|uniref:hypothetical protein n=1 Tax=Actinomadura sp. NTSP31 TaxID=1735447 RepID=UPI0035C0D56B
MTAPFWEGAHARQHAEADARLEHVSDVLAESVDWRRDPAEVDAEAELAETFRALGLDDQQARLAARGRTAAPAANGFDALADTFKAIGLDESQARAAAIGRSGTEQRARQEFTAAAIAQTAASLTEAQATQEAVRAFLEFQPWAGAEIAREQVAERARRWALLPEAARKARLVEYTCALRQAKDR